MDEKLCRQARDCPCSAMPTVAIVLGPHLETVHVSARHETDQHIDALREWLATRPAELWLFYEALKLTRSPCARDLAARLEPADG
jgi:hypothetical protein